MRIVPVPVRSDNYAYLLIDTSAEKPKAVVVDPFDMSKVHDALKKEGIEEVVGCITTHHHQDHSGGNKDYANDFPSTPVWGGSDEIPALTKQVTHGDKFDLFPGSSIKVTGNATPCHTQDSICFYVEDQQSNLKSDEVKRGVFTGDTLFISGCGRFFEGTAPEMHKALNTVLAALPDDTLVYCGHEYTRSNVAFSAGVLPSRPAIQSLVEDLRKGRNGGVTTGVYTIGDEKKHNVFMLVDDPEVQQAVGGKDAVDTMQKLREAKNEGKMQANI